MKVIVCGAGEIGSQICLDLSSEDCELTVIDRDPNLLRQLIENIQATGIAGEAGDPEILHKAGAEDAGLIIAVTPSDHANIVICLVARKLRSRAHTMARLENARYMEAVGPREARSERQGATVVNALINPEYHLAQQTVQILEKPSLLERRTVISPDHDKAGEKLFFCAMSLDNSCSLLNTPLRQLSELFPDLDAVVVGFRRHSRLGIALPDDQLNYGDEVFICTRAATFERTLQLFGKDVKPCRNVILVGAGRVGMQVARQLDAAEQRFRLKVIERDRRRAEAAADALSRTVVLYGDAMAKEVLEEAGVGAVDAVVAVTHDDRTNLLVASKAKKENPALVGISLVNDPFLMPLAGQLGVDATIDPRGTVMSGILSHCRGRQISSVGYVGNREAEIIEARVMPSAAFAGRRIRNAGLPTRVRVAAIRNEDGEIVGVGPDTRLETHSDIVFFSETRDVPELLKQLDGNESAA